jgi:hypothetical protein
MVLATTGGYVRRRTGIERVVLAEGLSLLEALDDPPPELLALARALGDLGGETVCHDTLS